ncbi:Fur family transcriptional regulator [Bifidobacterium sp. UTBIF-78]|uniref:Fur family transcriptional regulator n=1 Tax=Bifidobacterium sp. UTBIF-78 TaxID=1465263 RepID=UPI002158AE3A|nr:Fur family transcriptional regulator [Bifidobacterium sp. UTBIF-78]TPF92024.1 Fur family transcriptional regulator [Bifidobacterium sp. UTBIF-78]
MADSEEQHRDERAAQSSNPRITRPRMLIERTLSELSRFATAQEITDILRHRGTRIGTTTAYRNLQMMADQGKLDVIHLNGETLYRSCVDHRHHHHIMCRSCGTTIEIEIPGLEQWIEQAAAKLHYIDVTHELEIYGLCPRCARKTIDGARNDDEQRDR